MPGLRRSDDQIRGLPLLPGLRLGALRMTWQELDRRERGTRFVAITPRTVLNSSSATHMAFWSINPYIGCEFGCAYCYARDTHRWTLQRALDAAGSSEAAREAAALPAAEAFERRILVKQHAAERLIASLRPDRLAGAALVIGTATDPYQPAERIFGVTRSLLEALLNYRGLRLGIITKSTLIARDTALLAALSGRHHVTIHLSLAAIDAPLLRRIEPRTPVPLARLRTMRKLSEAGVRVGLLIAPILPGITDGEDQLRALIAAAIAHGASWVAGSPLRMGPATRATLMPWLAHHRPDLSARYAAHYGARQHVSRAYQDALGRRLDALQRALGIEPRDGMRHERDLARARRAAQLSLEL
ncbi:MAG TPA: radical SAM protein [Gemmatimonadales bacterium]|jgi:DNA repair photolyase